MRRKDRHWPKPKHYIFDLPKTLIIATYLFYLLLLSLLIQGYFFVKIGLPLLRYKGVEEYNSAGNPVSIIICAKNERDNLRNNLAEILEQDYPEFEVVVLNDHSTDGTAELLSEMAGRYKQLHVFDASPEIKHKAGKKWALAEAISHAQYEDLLLTDADCRPATRNWLRLMSRGLAAEKDIVLGVGHYQRQAKWFDALIQYETFFTALCYLGFAAAGRPYMGVGRNLAYRKSLFMKSKDVLLHPDLASGDDDLFVQSVATVKNTTLCLNKDAYTYSSSPGSYRSWVRQKTRHYSTAMAYKRGVAFQLLLFKFSIYYFSLVNVVLLFDYQYFNVIIYLLGLRWLIWSFLLARIARRLGFSHALYLLPCLEIYFGVFDLWILLKNVLIKRTSWK